MVIRVFLIGWAVLVAAIILNALASLLGLNSWYHLLDGKLVSFFDIIWLFLLYPALLGLSAFVAVTLIGPKDKGDDKVDGEGDDKG